MTRQFFPAKILVVCRPACQGWCLVRNISLECLKFYLNGRKRRIKLDAEKCQHF